jgi:acyl-homoserine lactone synthase
LPKQFVEEKYRFDFVNTDFSQSIKFRRTSPSPDALAREIFVIRIIDKHSQRRFARTLDQHFRLRHEIFVQERGWKDFDRGTIETDQYDNEHSIYAVAVDDDDDAVGCFRLYPTTLPHMLSEQFASMVDGSIVERSDILELTRFSISKRRRDSRTYHELFLGLLEYCLSEGISGTTALMRTLRIPVIQSVGMTVHPLGLSKDIDGEINTAVLLEMTEESLARVRKSAGIFETVMEESNVVASRVA